MIFSLEIQAGFARGVGQGLDPAMVEIAATIENDVLDALFHRTLRHESADARGGGTQLTLTEDGFINPPMFRALAKWFFGLDTTQRDFLTHLEKHLAAAGEK